MFSLPRAAAPAGAALLICLSVLLACNPKQEEAAAALPSLEVRTLSPTFSISKAFHERYITPVYRHYFALGYALSLRKTEQAEAIMDSLLADLRRIPTDELEGEQGRILQEYTGLLRVAGISLQNALLPLEQQKHYNGFSTHMLQFAQAFGLPQQSKAVYKMYCTEACGGSGGTWLMPARLNYNPYAGLQQQASQDTLLKLVPAR